jgi:hypothetical protein
MDKCMDILGLISVSIGTIVIYLLSVFAFAAGLVKITDKKEIFVGIILLLFGMLLNMVAFLLVWFLKRVYKEIFC